MANIVSSVSYTSTSSSTGYYSVFLSSFSTPFGTNKWEVLLTWKSIRATFSGVDNDLYGLVCMERDWVNKSFKVYVEETSSVA